MKTKAAALGVLVGLGAAAPGWAEPADYVLDSEHVTVGFLAAHIGYAKVLGQFRKIEGSYRFDETTGELSNLSVVVDTSSVTTNHDARDEHLRGGDFLNSRRFPQMRFTADRARRTGERTFEVDGRLELLGQTQPLTLSATWNKSDVYPIGGGAYVMGVSARGTLQRGAYGMTYAIANGWVGNDVEIIVEFEARRQ